jgi:uncharacterized small protein (DUF1192 family)
MVEKLFARINEMQDEIDRLKREAGGNGRPAKVDERKVKEMVNAEK